MAATETKVALEQAQRDRSSAERLLAAGAVPARRAEDARSLEATYVQTNSGNPVVGTLEIGLHGQNLLQRLECLQVLKALCRAPQDKSSSQVCLG